MAHDPGSRANDGGAVTVDLVELDGRGGPYQHAVAVADELDRAGVHVVLHTATDAELMPRDGVEVCRCMDWLRDAGPGRRVRVAARFLAVTVPRLLRGRGVLHVQGPFKASLLAVLLAAARLRGRRVVFSPHNTFSRRGSALDARLVRLCARLSHATVVFSDTDARQVAAWGTVPVVSPLLQHVPPVDPARVEAWRASWGSASVVLFAGQIRSDKRLDLVIEAARLWTRPARLAVVGKDLGDARRCRALATSLGVEAAWAVDYFELEAFAAAVAAADVIVCPYTRASQSGVLAVAGQLGVPSVATDVGGLRELATVVVPRDVGAAELARAVDDLLAAAPARGGSDPVRATVEAHRRAYGVA